MLTVPDLFAVLKRLVSVIGAAPVGANIRVPPRHAGRAALRKHHGDDLKSLTEVTSSSPVSQLTVGVAVFFRSGMSAMLGLLAFPSRGLPPSTGLDFLL